MAIIYACGPYFASHSAVLPVTIFANVILWKGNVTQELNNLEQLV